MKNRKVSTPIAAVVTSSPVDTVAQTDVIAETVAPAAAVIANVPVEATPEQQVLAQEAAPKKIAKVKKVKKVAVKAPKLVRDRFTMPESDYATLAALKQRARLAGVPTKKSQLLLAGLKALAAFPDSQFLEMVSDLDVQKSARPA